MKIITSLIISLSFLTACSTATIAPKTTSKPSTKHTNKSSVVAVNLKALSSLDLIANKLAKHRTVFVGETHTRYSDHLNQLAVIQKLHKHWGINTSIGLEMIQKPYQSFLDNYITGKLSEKEMLRGTQWYQRWKYDFRLYRPIFEYAKQHKIPLIALNIPKELTQRITQVGIKGLSKIERKQLPVTIDRSNKAYIKRITSVFKGHARTSSKEVNKFIDAQLGWDEGMAFHAANYLNKHPEKKMIILAGGGHVVAYQGIPDRLDRQIKSKSVVVLNNAYDDINNSGDYLLFSPEKKLPSKVQLGIAMEDAGNSRGVKVSKVLMHSAAQKAGLKAGDIIVKMDNQAISDMLDLKLFLEEVKAGSKVELRVERKGQNLKFEALLKSKLPATPLFSP